MSFINDTVLDAAVSKIVTDVDRIDITTTESGAAWASLAAITLGFASVTCGSATDGVTNGRRTIVPAVSSSTATVTATGTAAYWALVDSGTAVLAAYSLSAPQAVTSGNTFTLTSFSVTFPDPA